MKETFTTMLLAILFCIGSRTFAQEYTFTGSGSWSSSSNWDSVGVPPNPLIARNIYINGTGPAILDIDQIITNSSPFGSLLRIQASNTLIINPGKQLTISASYFENYGTLMNHGRIDDIATTLNNFNASTCTNNGTLNFSEGGGVANQGSLINNGTISNGPTSNFYNASTFTNNGIVNNNSIYPSGSFASSGTLDNYGTLNNSGPFYNLEVGSFNTTAILNNYSIINNNATGIFNSAGSLNNYSTLNNNSGGQLIISSGFPGSTLNNNTGGTITNAGDFWGITSGGSPITITNNGFLNNEAGSTLTINLGSTLTNTDTLTNNGQFTNNGNFENTGVLINNSTLNNIGTLNNNIGGNLILNTNPANFPGGTFNWEPGSTVTIGITGSMTVASPFSVLTGRNLVIAIGGIFKIQ